VGAGGLLDLMTKIVGQLPPVVGVVLGLKWIFVRARYVEGYSVILRLISRIRLGDTKAPPDERLHYGTRGGAPDWHYSQYALCQIPLNDRLLFNC
jgi:hypothetical protein